MNWTNMADSAQTGLETVGTAMIPVALAIVALVAGARMGIKLLNRAVGK